MKGEKLKGYPLRFTGRIIGDSLLTSSFAPPRLSMKGDWDRTGEGKSFLELVTFTGFLPIPKPESYGADLATGGDRTKGGIVRSGNMFGTTTQRGFVNLEDLDMENNENANTGEAEHKVEGRGREHAPSTSDAQELDRMAGGSSMRVATGDVTQNISVDMSLDGRLPAR